MKNKKEKKSLNLENKMKKKKKEGRRHDNMTWMLWGAYKGARCAMASTLLKVSVIYEKW